jgi:hypothetical protein
MKCSITRWYGITFKKIASHLFYLDKLLNFTGSIFNFFRIEDFIIIYFIYKIVKCMMTYLYLKK